MTEVEFNHADDAILPFPLQNSLTRSIRTAAARENRAEFLSLWSGQGVRLARRQTASDLVARLAKEIDATLARLQTRAAEHPSL
jgi:nitronate monooxygenase